MAELTLKQNVRLFARSGSVLLRTAYCFQAGSKIYVADNPEVVTYDHKDQIALQVLFNGEQFYVLIDELGDVGFLPSITTH